MGHLTPAAILLLGIAASTQAVSLERLYNKGISQIIEVNIIYNQTKSDNKKHQYDLTHTRLVSLAHPKNFHKFLKQLT